MRNKYVVRVDPQGQTMVVDILDMAGVSVPAYESPQFAATARALPLTITTQTDFCLAAPGAYDVSCKVGGSEVAEAGAPKRVRLTDVPVQVTPDWERQRTAASAASGASPCWFNSADTPALPATVGTTVTPQWAANTDGLAAGADVIVDGADATKLRVVNPGTYMIGAQAGVTNTVTYDTYSLLINKNDGSVGPEYYVEGDAAGMAGTAQRSAQVPTMPTVLQTDDTLQLQVIAAGGSADAAVPWARFYLLKVSDNHPS